MHRSTDNQYTYKERWTCTNKYCKKMIVKEDIKFLAEVIELMNLLVANPSIIEEPHKNMPNQSQNLQQQHNEIRQMLNEIVIDKDELKRRMLRCAATRYEEIEPMSIRTQYIKNMYKEATESPNFQTELCLRTIEQIVLCEDGSIELQLINGQYVNGVRSA